MRLPAEHRLKPNLLPRQVHLSLNSTTSAICTGHGILKDSLVEQQLHESGGRGRAITGTMVNKIMGLRHAGFGPGWIENCIKDKKRGGNLYSDLVLERVQFLCTTTEFIKHDSLHGWTVLAIFCNRHVLLDFRHFRFTRQQKQYVILAIWTTARLGYRFDRKTVWYGPVIKQKHTSGSIYWYAVKILISYCTIIANSKF